MDLYIVENKYTGRSHFHTSKGICTVIAEVWIADLKFIGVQDPEKYIEIRTVKENFDAS